VFRFPVDICNSSSTFVEFGFVRQNCRSGGVPLQGSDCKREKRGALCCLAFEALVGGLAARNVIAMSSRDGLGGFASLTSDFWAEEILGNERRKTKAKGNSRPPAVRRRQLKKLQGESSKDRAQRQRRISFAGQLLEGASTWSMIKVATGAFIGTSFKPSCSWIAVKSPGRSGFGSVVSSGVHFKVIA
jgi:hypothetical protein